MDKQGVEEISLLHSCPGMQEIPRTFVQVQCEVMVPNLSSILLSPKNNLRLRNSNSTQRVHWPSPCTKPFH